MNNTNPLLPKGSLLEQQSRNRPFLRIALFIVAVHMVFLGGLLIQGCKRDEPPGDVAKTEPRTISPETDFTPLDPESLYQTNPPAIETLEFAAVVETNEPIVPETIEPAPITEKPTVPPPAPERMPAPATQQYVVDKGDSFYSIGKKFGVSHFDIAKANPGVDPLKLRPGQTLQIPPSSGQESSEGTSPASASVPANTYTVRSGDTLSRIASAHGTSIQAIKEANGLITDRIYAGKTLKIPSTNAGTRGVSPSNPEAQ